MVTSEIIKKLHSAVAKYGDLPFEVSIDITGIVYEGIASDSGEFFVCKNEYKNLPDHICLGNIISNESE